MAIFFLILLVVCSVAIFKTLNFWDKEKAKGKDISKGYGCSNQIVKISAIIIIIIALYCMVKGGCDPIEPYGGFGPRRF